MRALSHCLLFCGVVLLVFGADAPSKGEFGREVIQPGERLLVSYSVHAKITIINGKTDKELIPMALRLPAYPAAEIDAGVVGEACVRFIVTNEGSVENVTIKSSSDIAFVAPSKSAVLDWKFAPTKMISGTGTLELQAIFLFSKYQAE
jgi:TonB family protein